jgi:hypothetical protein
MACITRIINATPALRILGLNDKSGEVIPIPSRDIPQHLPLWIVQTERGKPGYSLVDPSEKELLYGDESFKVDGKYTNHQTIGASESMGEGNLAVIYRTTKATRATLQLSLDVLPTQVNNHKRNSDGSIMIDATTNQPVPDEDQPTVDGYSIKWVLESVPEDEFSLGTRTIKVGSQTDAGGGQSELIPVLDLMEEYPGEFGNNVGIRLYAPDPIQMSHEEMLRVKSFPYIFGIIERENANSTPRGMVATKYTEPMVEVHLNPEAKDPYSGSSLELGHLIKDRYNNTEDPDLPLLVGHYNTHVHVYHDYINDVVTNAYTKEKEYIEQRQAAGLSAVSSHPLQEITDGEQWMFNLLGGYDSKGAPYYTYRFNVSSTIPNGFIPSKNTNLWANSAEDNIMSTTEYEREVRAIISEYQDCTKQVQDLATHPQNRFYDTGFGFDTKRVLGKFIAQRPDTFVHIAVAWDTTNVKGYKGVDLPEPEDRPEDFVVPEVSNLSKAQELQYGAILLADLRSFPESSLFGTESKRGLIIAGNRRSSKLRQWKNPLCMTTGYLVGRSSAYMGAANRTWKDTKSFGSHPLNVIRDLKMGYGNRWMDYSTRIEYWKNNIVFPLSFDYDYDFMPALQTIASDDTSVTNSYFNMLIVCDLWTLAYKAWRRHTGNDKLSKSELLESVRRYLYEEIAGSYDGRAKISVIPYYTTDDRRRNYSWTVKFQVGLNGIDTVQSVEIETWRFAQLTGDDFIVA